MTQHGTSQTTPEAGGSDRADAATCADLVRRGDRDRWLTALFAPAGDRRDALMALFAWNLEVARIPDAVSEGIIGQMRLQWWRETIEAIFADRPRSQPIARELHRAVRLGNLPAAAFDAILEARERDVAAEPPSDMPALERYAADTAGRLAGLAALCLDGEAAEGAARAGGTAYGLAGLLRALPWHAERRRVYLPLAELRAQGVVADNIVHRSNPPGLYAVIAQVAEQAAGQLAVARRAFAAAPSPLRRRVLPAMLPASLAAQDLARLKSAGFDPERPRAHASPLLRQWRVLRAGLVQRP